MLGVDRLRVAAAAQAGHPGDGTGLYALLARLIVPGNQVQGGGRFVGKQVMACRYPFVAVDNHPYRVPAGCTANGQPGVVCACGACAHYNRVTQGTDPVQVGNAVVAIDKPGTAGHGGDAAIQALA